MKDKEKMPTLFEFNIEDKDEVKSSQFISKLQKKGFIGVNKIYLQNYINADMAIAFAHIKQSYKDYVCQGSWPEDKFEDIIYIIARDRQMLIPAVFLRYGSRYDDGKLTKDIELEKRKYETKQAITDDEKELLEYIAKHGGR